MVSSGSDREGGYSSDSDTSDSDIDQLVDNIVGKLSVYPVFDTCGMTIKNRKDRLKPDRQNDRDSANSSGNARHSHNYKPYPYGEDRRDPSHRGRLRSSHTLETSVIMESTENPHGSLQYAPYPIIENSLFQPSSNYPRLQQRPAQVSQSHECMENPCELRPSHRDLSSIAIPKQTCITEMETGNNSEDEYCAGASHTDENQSQVDESNLEKLLMEKKGWKIVKVKADGGCLFRSVSHQIFGDEEKHCVVREQVINYMLKNKEHFSPYITEEFERYIERKRDPSCHGNHIEIQAIAELYNRPVEIYHDSADPINVFHAEYSKDFPIRLSYHGRVHYNSVVDPFNPAFGHGLGMPNYQPSLPEPDLVAKAIKESEATQLEETLLREKLTESEKSEIERCIEAEVIRESYYDYVKRLQLPVNDMLGSSSSSAPTEAASSLPSPLPCSLPSSHTTSIDIASSSNSIPTSQHGPQTSWFPSTSSRLVSTAYLPTDLRGMDEDAIVAMVMEQSRQEYLASLRAKHNSSNSRYPYPNLGNSSDQHSNERSLNRSSPPSTSVSHTEHGSNTPEPTEK